MLPVVAPDGPESAVMTKRTCIKMTILLSTPTSELKRDDGVNSVEKHQMQED